MLKIGIDPGVNNGFAILNENKQFKLKTLSFWYLISEFEKLLKSGVNFSVYIEDPTGNKPVFPEKINKKKLSEAFRVAQNVGSNKRTAQLIFEYFDLNKIKYFRIVPRKNSLTKISKERLKQLTKYDGRSSSHSRDACCLLLGR